MANRNVGPTYTLEAFRQEFNLLSGDVGDFTAGITNSVPSGAGTSNSVEEAVMQLTDDVNKIINGTYQFTGNVTTNQGTLSTQGFSIATAIALS